jgi:hypothetical protein
VFFRKSAYRQAGGIDATLDYALDYDLWLRMLATDARFAYIPELLSATRLHGKSKTATGQSAFTREVLACQARHFPDSAKAVTSVVQADKARNHPCRYDEASFRQIMPAVNPVGMTKRCSGN